MKKSKIRSHHTRSQGPSARPVTARRLLVETLCERRVLATVTGMVFSDTNDDWRAAAHEVKLADRLVFADHNDNGLPDDGEPFALTDIDGNFSLEQLGSDDQIIRLFGGSAVQQPQFPLLPRGIAPAIDLGELQFAAESGKLRLDPFGHRAAILSQHGITIADLASRESYAVQVGATPVDFAFLADGSLLVLATDGLGNQAFHVAADGLVQPVDLLADAWSDGDVLPRGDSSAPAAFAGWTAISVDADGHGVLIPRGDGGPVVVHQLISASGGISSWDTATSVDPNATLAGGGAVTTVIAEPSELGLALSLWSNSSGTVIGAPQIAVEGGERLLAYSDPTGLAYVLLSADADETGRSVAVLDASSAFAPLQTIPGLGNFIAIDTQRSVVFAWSSETSRLRAIDALTAETVADWLIEPPLAGEPLELAFDSAANELVVLGTAGLATVPLDRVDAHRVTLNGSVPSYQLRFAAQATTENQPPLFVDPLEFEVIQGEALTLSPHGLLWHALDPDGDPLVVVRTSSPEHGVATVAPDGTMSFLPDAGFVGTDSFRALLHDGQTASAETIVKINVLPAVVPEPELTITVHPVPENIYPGFVVGEIEVLGFGGRPLIYTIADPRFEVIDGFIVVAPGALLNYEDQDLITTSVTAWDEETDVAVTRTFSVQLTDEDDAIADIQPRSAAVHENVAGELIAELMVIDEDAEQLFFFSVDDDRFEIHHRNLRLKPGVSLDYEAGSQITIQITATDAFGGGNSLTVPFTIEVIDAAEAAGTIALTNDTVMEWVPGAEVGEVIVDGLPLANRYVASVDDSRFEIVGGLLKLRPEEYLTFATQQEAQLVITVRDSGQAFPAMSETFVVSVLENGNPFHNSQSPYDVNSDGIVTPLDALLIINALSRNGGGGPITSFSPPGRYWDVNGDGLITPLDALLIINYINRQNRNQGLSEPEAQVQTPPPETDAQQDAGPRQIAGPANEIVTPRSQLIAEGFDARDAEPEPRRPAPTAAELAPAIEVSLVAESAREPFATQLAVRGDRLREIVSQRRELAADWERAINGVRSQLPALEQRLKTLLTPDQLVILEHRFAGIDHTRLIARIDTLLGRLDRA